MTKTTYKRNGNFINPEKELKLLSFVNEAHKMNYNCASIGIVEIQCTNNNKKNPNNEFFGFRTRTGAIAGTMDTETKRSLLKAQRRSQF